MVTNAEVERNAQVLVNDKGIAEMQAKKVAAVSTRPSVRSPVTVPNPATAPAGGGQAPLPVTPKTDGEEPPAGSILSTPAAGAPGGSPPAGAAASSAIGSSAAAAAASAATPAGGASLGTYACMTP
jgi:hypothetical protein